MPKIENIPYEKEPEVTPEMIEAGVLELVRFNPDYESEKDAAIRIFLAMWEAKLRCRSECL